MRKSGLLWFGLFLALAGMGVCYLMWSEGAGFSGQGSGEGSRKLEVRSQSSEARSQNLISELRPVNSDLNPEPRTLNPKIAAFQGGGPLLGQADPIGPPPMTVAWTWKADEAERASIDCSPVISNGLVYVADGKGAVRALDLQTGNVRWTCHAGDGIAATPLVMDGKLFVGDLSGIVYAISADKGEKLWTFDSGTTIHSSANAAGSSIFFANDGGEIFCLNAADGKQLWKAQGGDRINSALALGNGLAYVGGCDAQLRALDQQRGRESFSVAAEAVIPGSPILVSDRILFGTDQGRVICISAADQKKLWTYEGVTNELMVYATPAVADGIVVVGARDRQVHAMDLQTGKPKWTFMTRGEVDAPAVISSGRVYVGSKDKILYVLDLKTGTPLWQFNAAHSIESAVSIAEGRLVFADTGGTVFCLMSKQ